MNYENFWYSFAQLGRIEAEICQSELYISSLAFHKKPMNYENFWYSFAQLGRKEAEICQNELYLSSLAFHKKPQRYVVLSVYNRCIHLACAQTAVHRETHDE